MTAYRFILAFFVLCFLPQPVLADFEQPETLKADTFLEPSLVKGEYHTVQQDVENDGLFNHYIIDSSFGLFKANSTHALKNIIHEITAIAAMKKVEVDDTAMASLKQSGKNTVAGVKGLVNDPGGTMKNAATGVGSLFSRVTGTVGQRKRTDAEDSSVEQLFGLSKSKGVVANRFHVNMYSSNQVLQEELDRLGRAEYLGGLGVGVASSFVPGVGGLVLSVSGTARLLNEAINTTPASELWLQNKNKLLGMGMDQDTVELFLNNPSFTPALQTVIATALDTMGEVKNRELLIKVALQANDPEMAAIITEVAVMTAGYHKNISQLSRLAPMARLSCGIKKDGSMVLLLPADHLIWSKRLAQISEGLTEQAKTQKNPAPQIWLLGDLTDRAEKELTVQGWQVQTQVQSKLIKQKNGDSK